MSSVPPESGSTPAAGEDRRRGHGSSLATRLVLGVTTILLVTLTVYTVYVLASARQVVEQRLAVDVSAAWNRAAAQTNGLELWTETAAESAQRAAADVLDHEHGPGSAAQPEGTLVGVATADDLSQHTGSALDAVTVEASGGVRHLSDEEHHDLVHGVLRLDADEQATVSVGGVEYRVKAAVPEAPLPWAGQERVLLVGLPTHGVAETHRTTLLLTVLGVLITLAAAAALARFWITRALRPLGEVARVAGDVARMDLAGGGVDLERAHVPRRVLDGADEVAVVGEAMDRLVGAVDAALDRRRRDEQAMREFVADASHELRTPLASVRGYAEMLSLTEDLSENGRRSLNRVLDQADRMTRLVDGMLVLARLQSRERGRVMGLPHPSAADAVTQDPCEVLLDEVMDARAAWPDHRWEVDVPDGCALSHHAVPGDRETLGRIVGNLLSNAGRHTPPGTTVRATARVWDAGDGLGPRARLRVKDDGGGIPADALEGLFTRFTRGVGAHPVQEHSTGLGLAIVRMAARGLGGEVTVCSADGWTRFDVELPLVEAPPGEDAAGEDAADEGR